MVRSQDLRGRDAVIKAQNAHDGFSYRASIIWRRKWIETEEVEPFSGQTQIERHAIFAEAWIWRGGWFNLTFQPSLAMSYSPTEPTDPRPEDFRELARKIMSECNIPEVAAARQSGLESPSIRTRMAAAVSL